MLLIAQRLALFKKWLVFDLEITLGRVGSARLFKETLKHLRSTETFNSFFPAIGVAKQRLLKTSIDFYNVS
mgnify:CR=1 FL=1